LTHLLLSTELTGKQREYLNAIVTSSDMLSVIVNDILDISKIEAGKLVIEEKSFKLKDTISGVVEVFSGRAVEKNLILNAEVDDALPAIIIGDAVRLNQILYNLISNAIKFTKEGEIKLQAKARKQDVASVEIEFGVSDTGIGIEEGKLKYIFEAFAQAKSSTSRKYGGTGLGLTIVKRLIELQGGSIVINSKPGIGTEVTFVLSFKTDKTERLDASDESQDKEQAFAGIKGLKVLLAEDNPVNQLVTMDLLDSVGVQVVLANNGAEALESLESDEFDVVLMDIQMPVMDGHQAMKHIRAEMDPKKRNIPILALTAHATEGEMEKCKRAGASDYLPKPFNPQDLFSKIAVLARRSSEAQSNLNENGSDIRNEVKITDLNALRDFTGGKVKLMINTINVLISELPKNLQIMQETVKNKDWKKLRGLAHKTKPNMMLIGAETQKEILLRIEQDAGKGVNLDKIPELVDQVAASIPQIIEDLEAALKSLGLELESTG